MVHLLEQHGDATEFRSKWHRIDDYDLTLGAKDASSITAIAFVGSRSATEIP
jgi:hypothetical protein